MHSGLCSMQENLRQQLYQKEELPELDWSALAAILIMILTGQRHRTMP